MISYSGNNRKRQKKQLAIEQLEDRRVLATVTPHGQLLSWPGGSPFATFGPNEAVTIETGRIQFLRNSECPAGSVGDFFSTASHVFVVPSGGVSAGGSLTDISGVPNTVISHLLGGAFGLETIGFAGPDGTIGPGTYAVVYDECQNGIYDAADDALFDPAFEVVIPAGFPSDPFKAAAFAALKDQAETAAENYKNVHDAYNWLFELQDAANTIGGIKAATSGSQAEVLGWLFEQGVAQVLVTSPRKAALKKILNERAKFRGIHADPPDANFDSLTTLSGRSTIDPLSGDALQTALARVGSLAGNESALLGGLITALERYQGAEVAGDAEWGLIQLRATRDYVDHLSEHLPKTNLALDELRSAVVNDPTNFDEQSAELAQLQNRLVTTGFTEDERREARNLGIDDSQLDQFHDFLLGIDSSLTKAGAIDRINELENLNTVLRQTLLDFSTDLEDAITLFEAQPSLLDLAPIARAGGPYVANEGAAVVFDASGSINPTPISLYEWDLDGDGEFDDAVGATATMSYSQAFDGFVGVSVTNADGLSNVAYAPLSISNVNGAPIIVSATPDPANAEIPVGQSQAFEVIYSEPDGDGVSVEWLLDGVAVFTGDSFVYTPAGGDVGVRILEAVVEDDNALGGRAVHAWNVQVVDADNDSDGWNANVDCADDNSEINPGMIEIVGNGFDDDCNPETADIGVLDLAPTNVDASGVTTDPQTLVAGGAVAVTVQNLGASNFENLRAGSFEVVLFEDRNGNAVFDAGVDNTLGAATFSGDIPSGGQVTLDIDVSGIVLFRDNLIYASVDSADSIIEADETNNLIHSGAGSTYQPPVADWQPLVQWPWDDTHNSAGVDGAPAVAPLIDTNGDGLINERDVPAVIFPTSGNPNAGQVNELVALRGDTGEVIFQVPHPAGPGGIWSGGTGTNVAVGDIDGDGAPEILIAGFLRNPLYAFNNDGTLKWELDDEIALRGNQVGPVIADLDGDGLSEILYNRAVLNSDGTIRRVVDTPGFVLETHAPQVVDLNLDGTPEIVAGETVYDSEGNPLWKWRTRFLSFGENGLSAELSTGGGPYVQQFRTDIALASPSTAVVNLDADPNPEIVAVSQGANTFTMWIFNHDGTIHSGPFQLFEEEFGEVQIDFRLGHPTAADFDGDGQVEIAVAVNRLVQPPDFDDPSRAMLFVYESDGSITWRKDLATVSGGTLVSPPGAFDFDGDGASELVHLDAQKLYILDGRDGATLFEMAVNPSGTSVPTRYPTIADVDNDGGAEIIVPTYTFQPAGAPPRKGVLVLGDTKDNWIHARRIWNQWQYEAPGINEDASIPPLADDRWPGDQGVRQQTPIEGLDPFAAPDLTVSKVTIDAHTCPASAGITARIGNGGALHAPAGVDVRFYLGDPNAGGTLIGAVPTSQALYPGEFEDVTLEWDAPMPGEIFVTVNETPQADRIESSNLSLLPHAWAQGSGYGDNSFLVPTNFRAYDGIDGDGVSGWNEYPFDRNLDPNHDYEVHFPFPVNATSVTIENQFPDDGFLDGVLEFSNGFSTSVTLDANGEGTISFPEQTDVTWIRLTAMATKPDGAGLSEFIVAGSYVQPPFLLNEGVGRLANNIAASGIDVSPCDPGANLAPTVHAGLDAAINEGDVFSLAPAAFTDPGVTDTHTATIDWGDGSASEPGAVSESGGSIAGAHTYQEDGAYTITVSVTDEAGQTGVDALILTVANLAPSVEAGPDQSAAEGDSISLVASFVDPGVLDTHTATIDWGDGTIEEGVVNEQNGAGTVSGDHVYSDDGVYTVTVCVTDDEGDAGCAVMEVTVANAAPVVEAGLDQTINEGDTVSLVGAGFSDPGFLDTHTVLINWGDNPLTRFGAITPGTGSNAINASYEYEDSGAFTVAVCVTDNQGAETCDTFEVLVGNVAPTVTAGFDRTVNHTLSLPPAVFQDPGLADTHTATIDWGDGVVESGDVFQGRGSGTVSASHSYAANGDYTVQVTVQDDEGDTGSDGFIVTAMVENQPPSVQQDPETVFLPGEEQTHAFSLLDPNPDDTHTAVIEWGDGSPQESVELENNLQGFGVGFPAHTYASGGNYDITVCVTDDQGLTGCETITISVVGDSQPPTADAGGPYSGGEGSDITVDASGSTDPDNDLVLYEWDLDNDGQFDDAAGVTATFNAPDDGLFPIAVRVTDDNGATDIATTTVTVDNAAPEITAISTDATFDQKAQPDRLIALEASFIDLGLLDTHTATIDWGDGTIQDVQVNEPASSDGGLGHVSASHAYAQGGVYTVTLTLTDDDSAAAGATTTSVVTGAGIHDGVLSVVGTNQNDVIFIHKAGGNLKVHANFFANPPNRRFPISEVERIEIYACDGRDYAKVGPHIVAPVTVHGGKGDDRIRFISPGNDHSADAPPLVAFGGEGKDRISAGPPTGRPAEFYGGPGDDRLYGTWKDDRLDGGEGRDYIAAAYGDDRIWGGGGNDVLHGHSGQDLVLGGAGHDILFGGRDNDILRGDDGPDVLYGQGGNDILLGGAGNDRLYDSYHFNLLIGGDGRDRLSSRRGHQSPHGGNGLLIGSSTIYDDDDPAKKEDPAHHAALLAILAEWSSGRPLTERVSNILGGMGLAAGFPLSLEGEVVDDQTTDYLLGGGAPDFFFQLGMEDRVIDLQPNDHVEAK